VPEAFALALALALALAVAGTQVAGSQVTRRLVERMRMRGVPVRRERLRDG
jgi:hypothetical protein